ncbi:MAG TPA: tetratricopeptide repeat-containing diguanylate cyclase [Casimicrobiaceae bacterium]|nr:tetratricopeptide repeat-containing diguanylate cyclase [Casimicrobiaceae bacterium]
MTAFESAADWDERIAAVEREADRGDPRVALARAQELADEARARAPLGIVARALTAVALAARQLADYARALAACAEGLELVRDDSPSDVRSGCLLQRGHVYLDLGDYAHALEDAAAARNALSHPAPPQLESSCLQLIGMVQARLGDFSAAQRSYEESLALRVPTGDEAGVAKLHNSIGTLHMRIAQRDDGLDVDSQQHWQRAYLCFERARTLAQRGNDPQLAMLVDGNIAAALAGLGRVSEARDRFIEQLAAARNMGDRRDESLILMNLGEAHCLLGEYGQALARLDEALVIAVGSGARARASRIHRELAKTYESAGDLVNALHHFKSYHTLDREAHSTEARRSADALLLRSEIARVQREAETLRRERADLARVNVQLSQQAREDPLTGLPNRRVLDEMLDAAMREARAIALAVFDVDRFKAINDTHSHAIGDAVLRSIADVLRAACRSNDLPVRLGGEEFVVLLQGAGTGDAFAVAERVRSAVASHRWDDLASGLDVTLSAGVAAGIACAEQNLLRAADAAMYRAKREGRNRVCAA